MTHFYCFCDTLPLKLAKRAIDWRSIFEPMFILGNIKSSCQSNKYFASTRLSALHHVSIGEEAEVRGKEDDVGDEDDAHVVRDLKNIFNCKDEIITFGQNEI